MYYARATNGTTPLHIAVKVNCLPIVKFFIEDMGIDVNEPKDKDRGRITPMILALSKGHYDIAHYLLMKGATITSETFYLVCKHANLAFMQLVLDKLKQKGYTEDMLKLSVVNGRFDNTGSTPFIRACQCGSLETVEYLYEKLNA